MAADSVSSLRNQLPATVKSVFEHPRYDEVMDSYPNCTGWMQSHGFELHGFVDGTVVKLEQHYMEPVSVYSPAFNDEASVVVPADLELFNRALKSSLAVQGAWAELSPHERCTHMYNMVRSLQKHQSSFGEMESMQAPKTIPFGTEEAAQMVRYLYHYAGVAMTLNERFPASRPKGQ